MDLLSAPSSSPIGNLADLSADEILLPVFVLKRPDGLYVARDGIDIASTFRLFIERVFIAGAYFEGLNYEAMTSLLYPRTPAGATPPAVDPEPVRLATCIQRFAPERRPLYKNVKSAAQGARVEYVFEPVHIERVLEIPLYGTDDDGLPVVVGHQKEIQAIPATLDADEFVAAMWMKGVRSGLDMATILDTINSGRTERNDIAHRINPAAGVDATVEELTESLHRDDSPAILSNGKIDLRHFKNRFPQVSNGTPLLKKVPRKFGQLGFETTGAALEPPVPRDFSIDEVAGPGTRVEHSGAGEVVIAARDGFLNIDTQSQIISVTEKIVNREGVSLRTTGDLQLSGDEFEEHGEVQERRVVEGRHMTFHADVFGSIVSLGGRVRLTANLCGGRIRNSGGVIQVDQRVSQSTLEARGGTVQINQAEGASIIAGKVTITRAIACDIIADEVEIEEAQACAITARKIRITQSAARKGVETLITLWMPDFTALDAMVAAAEKDIAALEKKLAVLRTTIAARCEQPELKAYLAASERMRSNAVKMTPAQDEQWKQATARLAKPLQEFRLLRAEIDTLKPRINSATDELKTLTETRKAAAANVACNVARINGDLSVRAASGAPDVVIYPGISAQEMKIKLRDPREAKQRLFHAAGGGFNWVWSAEKATP